MGYKDKYKNMSRSNLTFLNASGEQSHKDILAKIQKELDAELAKISFIDPQSDAKRATAFATAEAKIKAENARWEIEKSKRLDDLFGRVGSVFTATQTGLSTLGINPPTQDKSAPISGVDSYVTPPKDNTLLIVGGVVVGLAVIGYFVYKAKK